MKDVGRVLKSVLGLDACLLGKSSLERRILFLSGFCLGLGIITFILGDVVGEPSFLRVGDERSLRFLVNGTLSFSSHLDLKENGEDFDSVFSNRGLDILLSGDVLGLLVGEVHRGVKVTEATFDVGLGVLTSIVPPSCFTEELLHRGLNIACGGSDLVTLVGDLGTGELSDLFVKRLQRGFKETWDDVDLGFSTLDE